MWPLGKKKTQADKAIEVMDRSIELVAERWKYFNNQLKFEDGFGLNKQIAMFSPPIFRGMRKNYPALRDSPDDVLFLFVLKGIEKSGTHSKEEIEQAFNMKLP